MPGARTTNGGGRVGGAELGRPGGRCRQARPACRTAPLLAQCPDRACRRRNSMSWAARRELAMLAAEDGDLAQADRELTALIGELEQPPAGGRDPKDDLQL